MTETKTATKATKSTAKKAAAPPKQERVVVTLRFDREGPDAFITYANEHNETIVVGAWGLRAAMREVTGYMIEQGWEPVERNWAHTTGNGETMEGHGEVERSFRR